LSCSHPFFDDDFNIFDRFQRVSIVLDGSIIAFFKAKAGECGYQTLINQALHQAMTVEQI
jgi:uncharacterized protein (DUF4415 family)